MKRVLAVLLCLVLVTSIGLTACGTKRSRHRRRNTKKNRKLLSGNTKAEPSAESKDELKL